MGIKSVAETVAVATLSTAISALGIFLYQRWKNNKIPTKWEKVGTVKKLYIYPMKSGRRLELAKAECTVVGLKQTKEEEEIFQLRDRGFITYGETDKEFRTGTRYPKLNVVEILVHDENHLAITVPGMKTVLVKFPTHEENSLTKVKCWNTEEIEALDCGDEVASLLSKFVLETDSGLRLGYHVDTKRRNMNNTHPKLIDYYPNLGNEATGLFAYLSSILIVNQQSIDDMNKKIGNSQVTAVNFRTNIVVDGFDLKPYEEDTWDWIKIGNIIFRNVKECTRCLITTINPESGIRNTTREPLKTLESYRRSVGPEKDSIMGLHLSVIKTGVLSTGDSIYVVRK